MMEGGLSTEKLRPVWQSILDVYKPFAEICKRHRLRVWASAGTVLGAVRHKGFIPWDDDFDVMMPRDDYERFLLVFASELPQYLQVVSINNTPGYTLPFVKIQETRREIIHAVEMKIGYELPQGIYVDVYPLDGFIPDKSKLASRFWIYVYKCVRAWYYRESYPNSVKTLAQKAFGCAGSLLLPGVHCARDMEQHLLRIQTSIPFEGAPYCTYYEPFASIPKYFPMSAFRATAIMPFEDIELPIPIDYKAYLTAEYGADYMTPPPPEKRISTHWNVAAVPWKYGSQEKDR